MPTIIDQVANQFAAKMDSALRDWMMRDGVKETAETQTGTWLSARRRPAEHCRPRATLLARPPSALIPFHSIQPLRQGNPRAAVGRAYLPHPEKIEKGGEDAHLVCSGANGCTLTAVLDGVGGWSRVGVDSGIFSKTLAKRIAIEFALWSTSDLLSKADKPARDEEKPLLAMLQRAFAFIRGAKIAGSATVCLSLLFPDGRLHILNLGDSGIRIVRNSAVVFATVEQQHSFNCPRQLGGGSEDVPSDGDYFVLSVEEGDLVVAGSDGVWDNLWEAHVLELLAPLLAPRARLPAAALDHAARAVAEAAQARGRDREYVSPFVAQAIGRGALPRTARGGKLDDTTCLITSIPPPPGPPSSRPQTVPAAPPAHRHR